MKMTNNYYQKHKEKLQKTKKKAREKYENLSEEEKDKRGKKARERYQSFTEEEKEKESVIVKLMKIFLKNKGRILLSMEEMII